MKFQETKIVFDRIFLPKLKAKDAEIKKVLSQLNEERKNHEEIRQKLKLSEDEAQNHKILRSQIESKNAILKAQVQELNTLLQSSLKNAAGHRDLVADLNDMLANQTEEIKNLKKKCKKQDAEIGRLHETIKKFSNFFLNKSKK